MKLASTSCEVCAIGGESCCVSTEVYVTPGDVERIRCFTGREGFVVFAPFDSGYLESGADPDWVQLVSRSDGTRRILRMGEGGLCWFLEPKGLPYVKGTAARGYFSLAGGRTSRGAGVVPYALQGD